MRIQNFFSITLALLFLTPSLCFSQDKTDFNKKDQVEKLISKNFKILGHYKCDSFKIESNADKAHVKEGDFNHDGIKDIAVKGIAYYSANKWPTNREEIVIMVSEKNKFINVNLPYYENLRESNGLNLQVINLRDNDYLIMEYAIENVRKKETTTFFDTLSIENNHLMMYSRHPSNKKVIKIDLKTNHCFGTCPVFEISIENNLNVSYDGMEYVKKKGHHNLKAEKQDWDYLTNLIRNERVEDLKSDYSIHWTDHQTAFLTVVFEDGTEKKITDYGLSGTFGLALLYNYIFELIEF